MRLEAYDAFRYYMAIKMHFESEKYDCIRYNYKTSVNQKSFWKRKDKYHFNKIANKFNEPRELIDFFISYFITDAKWVGDMITNEEIWTKWQRRNQSLTYTFEEDINRIADKETNFDDLFTAAHSPYPNIVYYYLQEEVCIETVVILNKLTNFMQRARVKDVIVWPEISQRINKYSVFINTDLEKMKKIVLRVFTS